MITKIEISGVPPFMEKVILETDKKVNLIYGLNGTGKSTISNILLDIERGKRPNGVTIEYENGVSNEKSYKLIVYNQQFVQESFYESTEIKGIFSLSKDNAEAQSNIEKAKKVKVKLEELKTIKKKEESDCLTIIQNKRSNFQNELWKIKTDYSGFGQPMDYCLSGLKGDKSKLFDHFISISKSLDPPKRSIDEIKKDASELQRSDAQVLFEIPLIKFDFTEIETNAILSKVIVGNKNSSVAGLIKELNNSDWVRQGKNYLNSAQVNKKQKCPFCQQETITIDFIKEIESFFSEEYEKDLLLIKSLLKQYSSQSTQISRSKAFEEYIILHPIKNEYELTFNTLLSVVKRNIKEIEKKLEKPSLPIAIEVTKDIIRKLNDIIGKANHLIKAYNEKLKQKDIALAELKNEFWNVIRWQYDSRLVSYNQFEQSNQKQLEKLKKEINYIEEGLDHQERIILENQSKTINIEDAINNINEALLDMGIADFKIEKYSDSLYKLSREGQTGDVFKSLSEGEKMIISLLYFIERCKGKESKDDIESKKIVVIDDPISSLSHIYVYNVGRLLLQEFTDANTNNKNTTKYDQVFLLTHSLYFFYEMAITKRKDKEDGYNQKLFRIQKNQQGSHIFEMKYSEIQNDYHAYWMIVKDSSAHPALIANCMRNIIEYFFSFVEKKELNNVFNEKELQVHRFRAFNRYINRESHSIGQNIFDIKEFNYEDFKEAFKLVFELTGYEDHYKRMIK